jgi:hypothetical protein
MKEMDIISEQPDTELQNPSCKTLYSRNLH